MVPLPSFNPLSHLAPQPFGICSQGRLSCKWGQVDRAECWRLLSDSRAVRMLGQQGRQGEEGGPPCAQLLIFTLWWSSGLCASSHLTQKQTEVTGPSKSTVRIGAPVFTSRSYFPPALAGAPVHRLPVGGGDMELGLGMGQAGLYWGESKKP